MEEADAVEGDFVVLLQVSARMVEDAFAYVAAVPAADGTAQDLYVRVYFEDVDPVAADYAAARA